MAGRISGIGMRMLANVSRSTSKAGSSKVGSSSFAGYSVSVKSPSSELRSVLDRVQERETNSDSDRKSLSEYTVSVVAQNSSANGTTVANVGASDSVLAKMGVSRESLATLQRSIQSAFDNSLEMMPATIKTVASSASSALNSTLQSIMKFMKNAE